MIQDVHPLGPDQPVLVGEAFTLRYMPAREDLNKLEVLRVDDHGVVPIPPESGNFNAAAGDSALNANTTYYFKVRANDG